MAPKDDKTPASQRASRAVRDALGRFAPGKPKRQPKGQEITKLPTGGQETVVGLERPVNPAASRPRTVKADRSQSIVDRKPAGGYPPRTAQLDPLAVRVAARTFVNRMPDPEGETPDGRERRITRVAKQLTDGVTLEDGTYLPPADGNAIQDMLRLTPDEVKARAAAQVTGANRPGQAPLLYH